MRWQYKIVDFGNPFTPERSETTENQMNGYGGQGWEAVSAWQDEKGTVVVLFKRPSIS